MIDSLAPHISQTERLALCPVSPFVTIREDEQESDAPKLSAKRRRLHALCAKPKGWTMPSRLSLEAKTNPARRDSSGDFITIGDSDEDREQIETACFLPSARNRSAVSRELRAMGFAWGE